MSRPLRHVLLSSMKDEGPFVLEFVAHHRVLGFDAIHIASNDCTDGTDLLLDVLAEASAEAIRDRLAAIIEDGSYGQDDIRPSSAMVTIIAELDGLRQVA